MPTSGISKGAREIHGPGYHALKDAFSENQKSFWRALEGPFRVPLRHSLKAWCPGSRSIPSTPQVPDASIGDVEKFVLSGVRYKAIGTCFNKYKEVTETLNNSKDETLSKMVLRYKNRVAV